jgi:hypothetical protein
MRTCNHMKPGGYHFRQGTLLGKGGKCTSLSALSSNSTPISKITTVPNETHLHLLSGFVIDFHHLVTMSPPEPPADKLYFRIATFPPVNVAEQTPLLTHLHYPGDLYPANLPLRHLIQHRLLPPDFFCVNWIHQMRHCGNLSSRGPCESINFRQSEIFPYHTRKSVLPVFGCEVTTFLHCGAPFAADIVL